MVYAQESHFPSLTSRVLVAVRSARPHAQSATEKNGLRRAVPFCCKLVTHSIIKSAFTRSMDPSYEPISNIGGVAIGSNAPTQIARCINGTRVIDPGRLIERCGIVDVRLVDALSKAIPSVGASTTVANHPSDNPLRARHLDLPMAITCAGTIVILHQARVFDAVIGGRSTDTPPRLLHNDGQDEAVVDAGLEGDLLDGIIDGADFKAIVVDLLELMARAKHQGLIVVEPLQEISLVAFAPCIDCGCLHVYEGHPSASGGPPMLVGPVSVILDIAVGAGANSILIVNGGHDKLDVVNLSKSMVED